MNQESQNPHMHEATHFVCSRTFTSRQATEDVLDFLEMGPYPLTLRFIPPACTRRHLDKGALGQEGREERVMNYKCKELTGFDLSLPVYALSRALERRPRRPGLVGPTSPGKATPDRISAESGLRWETFSKVILEVATNTSTYLLLVHQAWLERAWERAEDEPPS